MRIRKRTLGILAGVGCFVLILLLVVLGAALVYRQPADSAVNFRTFSSCYELSAWMANSVGTNYPPFFAPTPTTDGAAGEARDDAYSTTNVQVEGVDEADVIKSDGRYIYLVQNEKVFIYDALSSSLSDAVAEIDLDISITGIFVHEDRLVVIGTSYSYLPYDIEGDVFMEGKLIAPAGSSQTYVYVYDLSDISLPKRVRTLVVDGNYNASRMIDGQIYLVANLYAGYYDSGQANAEIRIPRIADVTGKVEQADFQQMAECNEIAAFGDSNSSWVNIVSFDSTDTADLETKVLLGNAQTIYMSLDNLYLTATKYNYGDPIPVDSSCLLRGDCDQSMVLPESQTLTTDVFRIALADGLTFAASGNVPGVLLNQFSLDQHSGYLRLATTTQDITNPNTSTSAIFVLDENLAEVGRVDGLAKGEQIYSVRYIGERAYVVTFRTIDPLFVIDLSQPTSLKVLGELKIPGFSNYLHPYDDKHIIGFGKDTVALDDGRVLQAGLKVAMFDVSDPANPVEKSQLVFGGQLSDSQLLFDHRALLFDKSRGFMVFPANIYAKGADYSDLPEFTGFKVVGVTLTDGLTELASIKSEPDKADNYYFYSYNQRSLTIGDRLYTWDGKFLTRSDIPDFRLLSRVDVK